MTVKELLKKTGNWLRSGRDGGDYLHTVDDSGLINEAGPAEEQALKEGQAEQNNEVVVKQVSAPDKAESMEMLQNGFGKLIDQLQGINSHLNSQVEQHEELMNRIDQLPSLLENFPGVLENQKEVIDELVEQLRANSFKTQQFVSTVEKIPAEAARQSDSLGEINNQLSAAAAADVQMVEGLNKFNESLEKLDQTTENQTDSILQMSKTFATSDRYLKYILTKQNKRFMWIFVVSVGVCLFAILSLAVIIFMLMR